MPRGNEAEWIFYQHKQETRAKGRPTNFEDKHEAFLLISAIGALSGHPSGEIKQGKGEGKRKRKGSFMPEFSFFLWQSKESFTIPMAPKVSNLWSGPLLLLCCLLASTVFVAAQEPSLGTIRVVFQTRFGDIEFGFYPDTAPKTVEHILKLVKLGAYNTNHFFRVDKGFVAQVADVVYGREAPLNSDQREEGVKTIPGEFSNVKHVRGILSMGRHSDPNSGGSSFSFLLNPAPHLDGEYAVFGKVTKGDSTLAKMEEVETRKEGIFVMPVERINIYSSYYYDLADKRGGTSCEDEVSILRKKLSRMADLVQEQVKIVQCIQKVLSFSPVVFVLSLAIVHSMDGTATMVG